MAAVIVIAFSASSGGADAPSSSDTPSTYAAVRATPPVCRSAQRAVRFYRVAYERWRAKKGTAARAGHHRLAVHYPRGCPRYLAKVWRAKAYAARRAYERWVEYHWHWQAWLPDKWARIGACETGYGRRPGNWRWNSGTYQGAFGFYYGTWDQYKPRGAPSEAYLATPRQQYQCALNVAAAHGYGAWGCGGA